MPFIKGQPGGPGRPKLAERVLFNLKMAAREHSEAALRKVISLMESTDDRVALMAAQIVLDRGYGKPEQRVDADVVHRFAEVPQVMEKAQWLATRGDPSKVIEHQPADPSKKLN